MPRNRVKSTNRGTTSERTMQKAALLCLDNLMSEQSAATKFNICHASLTRYMEKFKRHRGTGSCLPKFGHRSHNKIFNDFQEKQLADYVRISADMYFGLNSKNIGKLAYEFSVKLDSKVPKSWRRKKVAGPDWITDFLKRNPSLFISLPKATSISRAINFNPENLKHFMDRYESILSKYKFQAHDIYNMDEIRVTFVQKTGKIVASRGYKHNKAIISGKDSTVNMYLAINAAGNLIPPMHIFSKAANNSKFMQGVEFLKIMKKFAKYVRPSVDKKVLILLDNHKTHICLPVIDFCKKAGILLLSFPPHGFRKLQPLKRSVYRPFNTFLNQNISAWIENNQGIKLRTYDVPLVSSSTSALVSAATPQNIINGFAITGIWPLNRDAFTKDTFTPAVFEDIDNMLIDNVDKEPINDVMRGDLKNTITELPANVGIMPHLETEESSTLSILSYDLDNDLIQNDYNEIKKMSYYELNNPGKKFEEIGKMYEDNVDQEPINDAMRELKNSITELPMNVGIMPHLETEANSIPSFPFSNSFLNEETSVFSYSVTAPETYNLIGKLKAEQLRKEFENDSIVTPENSFIIDDSLRAPETYNLIRKLRAELYQKKK
ncbi:uncharacterized protein LOC107883579 [Acyrthosiphon pisum]|uniref:DDE-1 domain-containing protein n=1 Tax=Acyrthosiphon pisum TaxID=7029 RepID=A0A8R2D369_ACYPI|nr:uncharacterized protein LOC107883579 [Acyrthosiphon pisum]|eukprot:XP_016659302.1 PREDICTED: uncharacterized protein LOC107883579 [Acyrthosiphon pisum]